MRILIVDDEPLARARLKRLLAQLPEHQCVAEAENASQALQQIKQLQPDLVLLDIAMPEQDGISLGTDILQLAVPPAVIFVTAHPQHALDAYQASPVGYLLKPVAAEALQNALQKAGTLTRAHLEKKTTEPKLSYVLGGVKRQLALSDIYYFTADDKYVRMVFKQGEALIEQSLVQLQQQFPQLLLRIHRRTLINKAYFARLLSQDGRHWVLLTGCADKLEVSRREVATLRDSLM
ncbi:MAG: LytTR family DNA-binding domain-containing protein [Gammaproteobacteria bacterium]|nr:LytTR family DNA-binding domain-containing protein [Gammaproteobacteria bacterium]MBU1556536.1 LytTR family DNA-binding domain-containing protein [Gammaproteobacteria bacterium]MBU2071351.1 LytTR family DNA-binding domain-containing protein [Gammaproteobacteria bacterium]MBU2182523.1 LytTR family DNA-binding domain-containing protein [Gammaproteobacteria bacterium]MBU2204683.1 LytTR family DNA-binding domain-containing protein [Gammaproteobacteria bacterium]